MCNSCEPQYFKLGEPIPPELHLEALEEKLHTVTVEWAEHESWCPSFFKVIQCFNCGAMGKITKNADD